MENPMTVLFSYVPIGEKFEFDGVTYVKTNHNRGIYYVNGKTTVKTFKRKKMVIVETSNLYTP